MKVRRLKSLEKLAKGSSAVSENNNYISKLKKKIRDAQFKAHKLDKQVSLAENQFGKERVIDTTESASPRRNKYSHINSPNVLSPPSS